MRNLPAAFLENVYHLKFNISPRKVINKTVK